MRTYYRGKELILEAGTFFEYQSNFQYLLIDLGTGDGEFPYRFAKEYGDWLCVGVDATAENMRKISNRIDRKSARGGVSNLLLVIASVESLPTVLIGSADLLTINFPWGSLQKGILDCHPNILFALRNLLKENGVMKIWLNLHIFQDDDLRNRLNLPVVDLEYVDKIMAPAYKNVGIDLMQRSYLGEKQLPIRTTWGQKLTLGSKRDTIYLEGIAT